MVPDPDRAPLSITPKLYSYGKIKIIFRLANRLNEVAYVPSFAR